MRSTPGNGANELPEWPSVLKIANDEFQQSVALAQLAVGRCELKKTNSRVPLEKENLDPHTLEASGEEVYYVAPYFHTTEELNTHYSNRTVAENSIWFRPSTIGALPDDDDHYIAFERQTPTAYFCSKKHRPLRAKLNVASVAERAREIFRARKKALDKQFFTRIANEILSISSESKEAAPQLATERFTRNRRRTRKQEAQFVAFLSRSLLNAELIILTDANGA
jgi:hypothetical protein